jgi:PKD repeat protein
LKNKKQNINLRELFREKLENVEVIPDATVKSILMRRVEWKEFLRFNPSRLNIYYIGGILIAAITTGALFYSGFNKSEQLTPERNSSLLNIKDSVRYAELPVMQPIRIKTNKADVNLIRSINGTRHSQSDSRPKSAITPVNKTNNNLILAPGSLPNLFSKSSILTEPSHDAGKLQIEFKTPAVLIDPDLSEGCAPLKVHFYCRSTSCDSCRWTFGDGGSSDQKDPEWIFDVEGEYKVLLDVFTQNGEHLSSDAIVTVHPRPQAHFEISPLKAIIPDNEITFQNYSTNAVSFNWDFGDGTNSEFFEPRHSYSKFGNYNVKLVVYSDSGCSDSLIVYNAFSGSGYFIDFPNAFLPNTQGPSGGYYSLKSDEAAQVFHPSYSAVSEYQLKIFSKLGILIFESNDINLGWDGYNNGQLCESGVYIWKVRGKFRNGEPFIKMGDVTLLKN